MAQIIGYRKDRLGARIIALGNLLFLQDRFGVDVRYLWPDGFESHDMAIENAAHPIFTPDFQEKYLQQVPMDVRPNIDGLTDIETIRGRASDVQFAERVQTGERFLCTEGLKPVLFANEALGALKVPFQTALARIAFAPAITDVLDAATEALNRLGDRPLALHVRRGDVLDQPPWCHRYWVSKFAPDEFYEVVMDKPGNATLLFSDTPEVTARLAAGRPGAVTLNDLLDTPHLSEMQRDLVELLLMARCEAVVAPSLSAFSSSASLISGMTIDELPAGLPAEVRFPAYDRLLERILKGPETFHNTGDFAQSIGYAFGHALRENRHHEMYALLTKSMDDGQKFAFYKPLAMALAIACGAPDHAARLRAEAQDDAHLWPDDKMLCDALGCVADHTLDPEGPAAAHFLNLYLARNKSTPHLDSLAHYFFARAPRVRELFMLDQATLETFRTGRARGGVFMFPVDDSLYGGALNAGFPLWIPAADWTEMFEKKQILKNITNEPRLPIKRGSVPDHIKEAELAFFQDGKALPVDPESLSLLSVLSVAFALAGRNRRATGIMFHCRKHAPENPLFLKRLANRFNATGDAERALNNLTRAYDLMPQHPGIVLALASWHQDQGDDARAHSLLQGLANHPLLSMAYYKVWEKSLRRLKARDARTSVIRAAHARFGEHKIFERQWADKY